MVCLGPCLSATFTMSIVIPILIPFRSRSQSQAELERYMEWTFNLYPNIDRSGQALQIRGLHLTLTRGKYTFISTYGKYTLIRNF